MKSVLRDYQQEALAKFLEEKHGTLALHPGAGKTILACAAIEKVGGRALIITPTIELVAQLKRDVRREFPDWNTEKTGPSNYHHITDDVDIFIFTYAAAIRKKEAWFEQFRIIVYDEAHHLVGNVYKSLLIPAFKADYALGLTATPPGSTKPKYEPDERRFFKQKRPEALERDANLVLQVLPVLYTRSFEQGREEGYAAPIKLQVVRVNLSELERKEYDKLSEEIRAVISKYGSLDKAVKVRGDLFTKRKMLVSMTREKFGKLAEIIKHINKEDDEPDRIFVWSEYIDALERADTTLRKAGIKSCLVHGKVPKKQRAQVFADWGRKFQVLLIAKLGEEGLDVPTVAHGVLIAGAKTSRQNVQRLGRLLRPMPGKTAKLWVVIASETTDEKIPHLVSQIVQ